MKKEANKNYYYPTSGLDLNKHLAAHNEVTKETPITKSPLLAAGLGAGLGGGYTAKREYTSGMENYRDNIFKEIDDYKSQHIDPHYLTEAMQRRMHPTDIRTTNQLKDRNTEKLIQFSEQHLDDKAVRNAGKKAFMTMPKSKLALGAGAGGALALLANKLLVDRQEN